MVELRKRPAPPAAAAPAPKKKAATKPAAAKPAPKGRGKKAAAPAVEAEAEAGAEVAEDAPVAAVPEPAAEPEPVPEAEAKVAKGTVAKQGESIDIEGFGGEVETNDGTKTTLAALVAESKAGVVLFTYPKASTPGCTKQACLFRDAYEPLTATGLLIYGLSTDSPKSNTNFKTKQNLPYPLLCDPKATLISAIGFKKGASTTRGVFVVDKTGKVLAAEPGGPAPTVEVVKKIVAEMGGNAESAGVEKAEERAGGEVEADADKKAADIAGEVADSAATLDAKA